MKSELKQIRVRALSLLIITVLCVALYAGCGSANKLPEPVKTSPSYVPVTAAQQTPGTSPAAQVSDSTIKPISTASPTDTPSDDIHSQENGEEFVPVDIDTTDYETAFSGIDLYSSNAILARVDSGLILYQQNAEEITYPASLTKIMTAIVAIERLGDLDATVLLTDDMFYGLTAANASMAGFQPGEEVAVRDLLYGVMLPSGADASNAVAVTAAGSGDEFIGLMNQLADNLGMVNTHFTNVHGLHDEMHYTTVYDLAILLEYALVNPVFMEIFTTDHYVTSPTNLSGGITMKSTMFKAMSSAEFEGGKIIGGKTGYTNAAGLCLASLAVKDGVEYIFITTNANGNHSTSQYHIIDAITAYETIPSIDIEA